MFGYLDVVMFEDFILATVSTEVLELWTRVADLTSAWCETFERAMKIVPTTKKWWRHRWRNVVAVARNDPRVLGARFLSAAVARPHDSQTRTLQTRVPSLTCRVSHRQHTGDG